MAAPLQYVSALAIAMGRAKTAHSMLAEPCSSTLSWPHPTACDCRRQALENALAGALEAVRAMKPSEG